MTAFVSPEWWPNNPGHVVVIPNHHYENLYTLPRSRESRVGEAKRALHATRLREALPGGS